MHLIKIHTGNNVAITDPQLGYLEAVVTGVSSKPVAGDGFMREVEVFFHQPFAGKIPNGDVMQGRIVISDISVLKKFLQSVGIK